MKNCSSGDKLNLLQCPWNDLQKRQMKDIPYASVIESQMHAQVCTRLSTAYTIEKLSRYLIILRLITRRLSRRQCDIYRGPKLHAYLLKIWSVAAG